MGKDFYFLAVLLDDQLKAEQFTGIQPEIAVRYLRFEDFFHPEIRREHVVRHRALVNLEFFQHPPQRGKYQGELARGFAGDNKFVQRIGFLRKIDPEIKMACVETDIESVDDPGVLANRRAGRFAPFINRRPGPFIKMREHAVDPRRDEVMRADRGETVEAGALDGLVELRRNFPVGQIVYPHQVLPEQAVKLHGVGGGMFISVPPAPVGALGNVDLSPGFRDGLVAQDPAILLLHQEIAGIFHQFPGAVILPGADPDVEIAVFPASRIELKQIGNYRAAGQKSAEGGGLQQGILCNLPEKAAQERPAVIGVVLPAVLPVEDDRDDMMLQVFLALCLADPGADPVQAGDEIFHRPGFVPVVVYETDGVGQVMIAEEHRYRAAAAVEDMGLVDAVAVEFLPQAAHEDRFIGGDPAHPLAGDQLCRCFGDPAFRGPDPVRFSAEQLLEIADPLQQLRLSVFRMLKSRRQGTLRAGYPGNLAVDQQGKNRMIKRRGGEPDLPALPGGAMAGDDLAHDAEGFLEEHGLIFLGKAFPFLEQLFQRRAPAADLADPDQVIPDLQVAEILHAEMRYPLIGRGVRGFVLVLLVELVIARVGLDHLGQVGQEEIFQDGFFLIQIELIGRAFAQIPDIIAGAVFNIILDLQQQRGHQVDVLLHRGKFLDQQQHVEVIFGGVKAHPGHVIISPGIFIIGLMIMPQKSDVQFRVAHNSVFVLIFKSNISCVGVN